MKYQFTIVKLLRVFQPDLCRFVNYSILVTIFSITICSMMSFDWYDEEKPGFFTSIDKKVKHQCSILSEKLNSYLASTKISATEPSGECCNDTHGNGAGGHNHVKSLNLLYTGATGNVNLYTNDGSGGTGVTDITQFVISGETVVFEAAGNQKYGSNSAFTYPEGFVELHTSCSRDDVVTGATFGPFEILGIRTANGDACGSFNPSNPPNPPNECPIPTINVPNGQICAGGVYTFRADDLGFDCLDYNWTFNGPGTIVSSSTMGLGPINATFEEPGTYTVSLTVTNYCDDSTPPDPPNPPNPPIVFGCCNQDERGEHDHPHKLILEYVGNGSINVEFTDGDDFTFFDGQISNGDLFVVDGTGHTDKHDEENRLETDTHFRINNGSSEEFHTSCSQDISPGFGITDDGDLLQNGTSTNSIFIVRGVVMLDTGSANSIYCEEGITDLTNSNGGGGNGGSNSGGPFVCNAPCLDCEEIVTITIQVDDCNMDPCINTDLTVILGADTTVCSGTEARIVAEVLGGMPPYTLMWSDDILSNGNCAQVVSPTSTTTYGLTVTDFKGCMANDAQTVTVLNCPPCNISVFLFQPVYNDNDTPNNLNDDTFTFMATINGSSPYGWTGGGLSGNYGQTVTFGPFPTSSIGAMFTISDAVDTNCNVSIGTNIDACIYLETCTCCTPD